MWDWLFKSCEVNGRILLHEGLIDAKDIVECIARGKCKKLGVKLPSLSILQCLLESAKSNSAGLVICMYFFNTRFVLESQNQDYFWKIIISSLFKFLVDEVELTKTNWPKDKIFEWFVGPLLIMKEQIKRLQLQEDEENCLRKLLMHCKNDRPEEWDAIGFPSSDNVKRAQLQAIIRRLAPNSKLLDRILH